MPEPLRRWSHWALAFLGLSLAIAAGWATQRYHMVWDLSANQRHSLVPASVQAIQALPTAPTVTAYLPPKHQARIAVEELVARYRRYRPELALTFVDPANAVDVVRAQNLQEGEVVLALNAQSRRLTQYTEEAFTQALLGLAQQQEQWIVFSAGHGERSPERGANFDLSHWAGVLKSRGYRVQELNLATQTAIPDNTSLLVLASPQLSLLPGEVDAVAGYLARGGSLLMTVEPDTPRAYDELASKVGFERLTATVVDPVSAALGIADRAVTVVTRYPAHPALAKLTAASVFPHAAPLIERTPPGWLASRLLLSSDQAWGETSAIESPVYQADADYPGPLPIGLALTRSRQAGEQRVVVLGDGDFLSNTYIGNAGNQDLGAYLVDWLVSNESLLKIESRLAGDVGLELTRWQQAVIGFGFLLVLPLAFVANGVWLGWKRRRA